MRLLLLHLELGQAEYSLKLVPVIVLCTYIPFRLQYPNHDDHLVRHLSSQTNLLVADAVVELVAEVPVHFR